MGLFDTIKEKLAPHHDKVDQGVDKAGDMADKKTGGKYSDQIDKGAEQAKSRLHDQSETPGPEQGPPAGGVPPEQNPPA